MIPVDPYKRNPEPPLVAFLDENGTVTDEHGLERSLERWPDGMRCWTSYDTAHRLVREGEGEAVCWNGEEIRWRHARLDAHGWKRRPSDVHVLRVPFDEDDLEKNLRALVLWRDWLGAFGAAPTSTSGGAAWSLLRATLEERVWLSGGDPPPLKQTVGGRQELGPAGQGSFAGRIVQLDLPAAYASELGSLAYGGKWILASDSGMSKPVEWWAAEGRPVFVRARVRVPAGTFGPLVRRPRRRVYGLEAALLGPTYPTGCILQGVWTWQELETARAHGARILNVWETWVHLAGGARPFLPWWRAVEQGRSMGGLAGLLAKVTGNALWGQFCMDAVHNGERTIVSSSRRGVVARGLPFKGGRPPAHDLAETVSGRVRARMFGLMAEAGRSLLSAHTDGAWLTGAADELGGDGWRIKTVARRIDLLDPQVYRVHTQRGDVYTTYAGVPFSEADRAFDERWTLEMEQAA